MQVVASKTWLWLWSVFQEQSGLMPGQFLYLYQFFQQIRVKSETSRILIVFESGWLHNRCSWPRCARSRDPIQSLKWNPSNQRLKRFWETCFKSPQILLLLFSYLSLGYHLTASILSVIISPLPHECRTPTFTNFSLNLVMQAFHEFITLP